MNTQSRASTQWRVNLLLLTLGTSLGIVCVYITWSLFIKPKAGTTFDNLTDLRKSMLEESSTVPDSKESKESLPLRMLISPHPSDQIIFDLKPHLDVRFQRAQVRTNSCGMRGPEVSVAKPPNTFRIALLGDSFTFGWGVEEHETFVAQMEANLNRHFKGKKKVEVLNFGVPGYSTFQEVARFEELGLDFTPDAVVVFFVENDYGPPFFIREMGSPSGQILSLQKFISKGNDREEQQRHLENTGRIDPNKALRKLANLGAQNGIPIYITINPKKRWVEDRKKLWVLRERKDIVQMNIYEQFDEYVQRHKIEAKELSLSFDPHPSPLKHKILGLLMAQYFF